MRQILLDTETTGLSPAQGDRVVEIGCVELLHRRLTGNNFHVYLNPERDMPQEAFAVHGLSEDFLADKPKFAEVAKDFLAYIAGAELIIHNAAFDLGFLNAELARVGLSPVSEACPSVVDTVTMARSMFPGKRASLDALCDRFEIDRAGRSLHGALLDAQLLAEVYMALTRGQNSLIGDASSAENEAANQMHSRVTLIQALCIAPDADELSAHQAILADIDKASKGKAVWRVA